MKSRAMCDHRWLGMGRRCSRPEGGRWEVFPLAQTVQTETKARVYFSNEGHQKWHSAAYTQVAGKTGIMHPLKNLRMSGTNRWLGGLLPGSGWACWPSLTTDSISQDTADSTHVRAGGGFLRDMLMGKSIGINISGPRSASECEIEPPYYRDVVSGLGLNAGREQLLRLCLKLQPQQ